MLFIVLPGGGQRIMPFPNSKAALLCNQAMDQEVMSYDSAQERREIGFIYT